MMCRGCGREFEHGDCVLVQSTAKYHYIPEELSSMPDTILFDCFLRSLGLPNGNDKIGVYVDGRISYSMNALLTFDHSSTDRWAKVT